MFPLIKACIGVVALTMSLSNTPVPGGQVPMLVSSVLSESRLPRSTIDPLVDQDKRVALGQPLRMGDESGKISRNECTDPLIRKMCEEIGTESKQCLFRALHRIDDAILSILENSYIERIESASRVMESMQQYITYSKGRNLSRFTDFDIKNFDIKKMSDDISLALPLIENNDNQLRKLLEGLRQKGCFSKEIDQMIAPPDSYNGTRGFDNPSVLPFDGSREACTDPGMVKLCQEQMVPIESRECFTAILLHLIAFADALFTVKVDEFERKVTPLADAIEKRFRMNSQHLTNSDVKNTIENVRLMLGFISGNDKLLKVLEDLTKAGCFPGEIAAIMGNKNINNKHNYDDKLIKKKSEL